MSDSGLLMGHPTMNANVRVAASALAGAGLLSEFHTTVDATRMSRRAIPPRVRRLLERRTVPAAVEPYAVTHPTVEIARVLLQRFVPHASRRVAMIDLSSRVIDSAVARRISTYTSGVYGYEDAARTSFQRAVDLGVPRVYELPIGHWRAAESIWDDESSRNPEWATTLSHRNVRNDSQRKQRKDEEISLASEIFVASTFTARTLDLYPGNLPPVRRIPYGCPPVPPPVARSSGGPVRVLFVGGLTQRKGISYLFDAMELVGSAATLTIVGSRPGASRVLDDALARHDWRGSIPHSEVLELMQTHDLLVFPSLFEGFGMVLTEALSQGLPFITTPNTAGPDLIEDGQGGWIVPIRSSEAIAERILLAHDDRALLDHMRSVARRTAELRSWEGYANLLVESVLAATLDDRT